MIDTIDHLCYVLRTREFEIDQIIGNIEHYYKEKIQPKKKYGNPQMHNGKGRYRHLCASQNRLKEIQQNLNAFLQANISLGDFAYGSVKGRDHIMNAIAHYGNTYFFSVDLRDFFTNTSNGAVYRTFRCYNFSPTISRKLTQLTTFKHELPQGPPSSPFIANMVFDPTGNKLFKKAQANQIIFTSYLDDLTFSSRVDFTVFLPEILKDLTDDGFVLNQKKISYRKTKAEITGIPVSSKGITVPNAVRERAKKNARVRQYSIRIENISNMLFH